MKATNLTAADAAVDNHFLNSVDIHDGDNRIAVNIRISQCDSSSSFNCREVVGHIQYWHWPEQSVNGVHFLCNTHRIGNIHVA